MPPDDMPPDDMPPDEHLADSQPFETALSESDWAVVRSVLAAANTKLDARQSEQLASYARWLTSEAVVAGGIGPNEPSRTWDRHIVDSLLFASFVADVATVLDVGSGVGLPGIPLAIALPAVRFTLLDRSGRRSELSRRAVRILGLDNVDVVALDVRALTGEFDCAVSRAAVPPDELLPQLAGLVPRVVVAGSRVAPPQPPTGWRLVEIPIDVTGEQTWFLEAWISGNVRG